MAHMRISPRHLGQMMLPDFCPRCFFYQVQMNFKLPFDRPMPGVMFHMDAFEKRIVLAHLDEHGTMPKWLKDLKCTSAVDFPAKMTMDFAQYDLTLVGMPDAVFENGSNNLYLIDWKTATYKGEEDPFLPIYAIQLLGYVHLLEHNKVGTVDSAALVYFGNELKTYASKPLDLLTSKGFDVPFTAYVHEVEIDRTALDPLLKKIREFADTRQPPRGRDKCKDCAKLQALLDVEVSRRGREEWNRAHDGYARAISKELEQDRQRARDAWAEGDEDPDSILIVKDQDAVPASWDW